MNTLQGTGCEWNLCDFMVRKQRKYGEAEGEKLILLAGQLCSRRNAVDGGFLM